MSRILIWVQGVQDNSILPCSADIAGVTISDRNQLSSLSWVEFLNSCSHFFHASEIFNFDPHLAWVGWAIQLRNWQPDQVQHPSRCQLARYRIGTFQGTKLMTSWGPTACLLPKVMCGVDVFYSIVAPLKEKHCHLTRCFEIIYVLPASNAKNKHLIKTILIIAVFCQTYRQQIS